MTMNEQLQIRAVTIDDAPQLLDIYRPYIEHTAITFEYDVPSIEEFQHRISETLKKYPYIAACSGDTILGYAYVSPFKTRAAYDWAVETSIYVRHDSQGNGIGRLLYEALEEILKKQNILNMNACIASPRQDDEYLNHQSIHFHEAMGYRLVGCFKECGYKFGRWYDMVWMEKHIGEHKSNPEPVKLFRDV